MGDVLTIYADEHATTVADPARIGWGIDALAPFWGDQPVSAVTGNTCRAYRKRRGVGDGTIRRELGILRAALNHCEKEGYLVSAPAVWMPEKPQPKDRWLTRGEVAKLLRATRTTNPLNPAFPSPRHLGRFILTAVYTGTRPGAVLALDWNANTMGGHVDVDRGVLYRAPAIAPRTKKRQTPVRIPRGLLAHMRSWHARDEGQGPVVRYRGGSIREIKSRTWQALVAAAGIDHCTPHSLRHTAATWLMQNGADKWDAAGFLGMTMETLEAVYGHHHPDHQGSAVDAMNRR